MRRGSPGPTCPAGRRRLTGALVSLGGRHALHGRSSSGAYVEDVDGARYLDFVQSYGASLLGHAHPDVVNALRERWARARHSARRRRARSCSPKR